MEPLTEYRLEVEVEGKTVRASTTTPERVQVRQAVLLDEDTQEIMRTLKSFAEMGDEVYTAPENQLTHLEGIIELHLEKVGEAYQAALFALEEDAQLLDEDFIEIYDRDREDLRANQSPPFAASDGIVRWPWFAVVYTGRSLIKVYAVDHNWFEYARSSPEQQEQGGFWGTGRRLFRAAVLSGRRRHRAVRFSVGGFGGVCRPAATVAHFQFLLDDAVRASLPAALHVYYDRWKSLQSA